MLDEKKVTRETFGGSVKGKEGWVEEVMERGKVIRVGDEGRM